MIIVCFILAIALALVGFYVYSKRESTTLGDKVEKHVRGTLREFGCKLNGDRVTAPKPFAGLGTQFSIAEACEVYMQEALADVSVIDPEAERAYMEQQQAAAQSAAQSAAQYAAQPGPFQQQAPAPSAPFQQQPARAQTSLEAAYGAAAAAPPSSENAPQIPGVGIKTRETNEQLPPLDYNPNP